MTDGNALISGGKGEYLDWMGAVTSGLCALHCALLPAVAAILPMIGLGLLAEEGTETALMGASAAMGTISLGLGFRRHRSGRALGVLAAGLGLLALGRVAEAKNAGAMGVVAVVAGGLAIAGAHLLNRRLCRHCHECRQPMSASDNLPTRLNLAGRERESPGESRL